MGKIPFPDLVTGKKRRSSNPGAPRIRTFTARPAAGPAPALRTRSPGRRARRSKPPGEQPEGGAGNSRMARGGARRTATLALALRLLLGLGLGPEAAPSSTRPSHPAPGPSAGSCPPSNFQCRTSGLCVPLPWRCDSDLDCPDGSDEDECGIEPCVQEGQCPPPTSSPCSCDSDGECPGRICSPQPCPEGQLRCRLDGACIPHTWHCDGHPDCSDGSDEQGCGTPKVLQGGVTVWTPVTQENVRRLGNATTPSVGDKDSVQSGSIYGVMAAAVCLSVALQWC
ncbi:CD320 antigen isoform X2 [Dasypus novemcinctus]|uniref:CD320 antigen isoform X2 n=1 Tax=Dasypus novemcinctus TaxID=9361 RepID=UPI0039C8F495